MVGRMSADWNRAKDGREAPVFVSEDPRCLIIVFLLILVFTFVIGRTAGLLLLLSYVVVLARLARVPGRRLARGLRNLVLFLLIIVAVNALLVKGEPLLGVAFLSKEGVYKGFYYGLRVVVLYFTLVLFLSVASQEAMASGLSSLLRPLSKRFSRRVALHAFLAIGFLPLFGDEVKRIRMAQGFRGGGIEGGLLRRVLGARTLIVPMFVSAIHRSGQLAMAVELRGIESSIERLLVMGGPALRDFVFAGATLIVLFAAVRV
jgi:energy-coupling factor transport system permease protein